MRKFFSALLCVTLCALSLTGCAPREPEPDGFLIVASIYPVYITLLNLTDGVSGVEAQLMAETSTGCLHDYTLLPGDMKKLEKADLFVINGAGMEGFLDRVVADIPGLHTLDASADIPLLSAADDHEDHEHEEHDHDHDHEDEEGDHEHETDAHDHEHEGHDQEHDHADMPNPHVWTSVNRYIMQVENITAGLCAADPTHAALYERNRDAYIAELKTLKAEMSAKIALRSDLRIITFHEAFEYLAEDFGLTVEAVMESEPNQSPSPRRLAELIGIVRERGISAIFVEPQYNDATGKVIAAETGCVLLTLDPIVTGARDKAAYLEGMRKNAETLMSDGGKG